MVGSGVRATLQIYAWNGLRYPLLGAGDVKRRRGMAIANSGYGKTAPRFDTTSA